MGPLLGISPRIFTKLKIPPRLCNFLPCLTSVFIPSSQHQKRAPQSPASHIPNDLQTQSSKAKHPKSAHKNDKHPFLGTVETRNRLKQTTPKTTLPSFSFPPMARANRPAFAASAAGAAAQGAAPRRRRHRRRGRRGRRARRGRRREQAAWKQSPKRMGLAKDPRQTVCLPRYVRVAVKKMLKELQKH